MKPQVFCLILNYNRPSDTVACAKHLLSSDLPERTKIIIIDNGSKDLEKYFHDAVPQAEYLKSPGNIGFAAGNNQGIKKAIAARASHVLIINPDVTVPRRFFQPLLKIYEKHPQAGLVAPAHTEGKGVYGLGGVVDWRTCSFPHDNTRRLPSRPKQYELLTFACVLIKREVFETVGPMDERYFLYLEDVDYCVAAANAGHELWLDPSVVVVHKTSSSFDDPRGKIVFSYKSAFLFIRKWLKFPYYVLPYLHTLYFYPKEYVMWTLKLWKRNIMRLYA